MVQVSKAMHCIYSICKNVISFSLSPHSSQLIGPCPPANVAASLECEGNVASVTWSPVPSAELYIVTATGSDGHTSTCNSNSTSCSLTSLQCAQNYSVTVTTIINDCPSDPSPSVELKSGKICLFLELINCHRNP